MTGSSPRAPILLRIGAVCSIVIGGLFVVTGLVVALGFGDTSELRDSSLGEAAIPVWCVGSVLLGMLLLAISLGLRAGQRWVRPLMLCYWAVLVLGNALWFAVQR